MDKELINNIIEVLEHYKELSLFVEDEVPYSIAQDIRQELYLNGYIDGLITEIVSKEKTKGQISDGYHTFDELYYHRMILFSVICNQNKHKAWKSKLHSDGTMYDNYFIVGITTDEGNYTYHYHVDNWNYFDVKELEFAPEYDGHKPEDITRLLTLFK